MEYDDPNSLNFIDPAIIEYARKASPHSIFDGNTVRTISMHGLRRDGKAENLYDRINPIAEYCGLYPFVMQVHNIKPDIPDSKK